MARSQPMIGGVDAATVVHVQFTRFGRFQMDKETAAKLDGMMIGSRMLLQSVADFVRDNVPEQERCAVALKIGTAMAELLEISWMIHDQHPSLNPYPEETRLAAELRDRSSSGEDKI
jgi:hypothetical protein